MTQHKTLIALGALALFAASPAIAEVEARCDALGEACICSETFDTDSYTVENERYANPANSSGPLQCAREANHTWFDPKGGDERLQVVPASDMPSGASVDYVWRATNDSGTLHVHGRKDADAIPDSIKRMCIRSYVKFSADWTSWSQGCNNKHMEFYYDREKIQLSTTGNRRPNIWVSPNWSNQQFNGWVPTTGDTISDAECVDNWCRMEMCIATNDEKGVRGGQDISVEGELRTVSGQPKVMRYTRTYIGDTDGGEFGYVWILNLYRQDQPAQGGQCEGTREFSHLMQAGWTDDRGQWIGAAQEIETGEFIAAPETPEDPAAPLGAPGRPQLIVN